MLISPTVVKVSVVLSDGVGGTGPALCRRLSSGIEREEKSEVRASPVLDSWDALSNVSVIVQRSTWHMMHQLRTTTALRVQQ